ncbi:MAG: hypothetical protein OFPII_03740 [Osedax symbiont Rs1]|nr:MAG: hypothetical protein OFPII_03740 [Osedax symbiont Rs1]
MFALKLSGQNNVQVMIGEGRSPVWPEGVRGSITHTDDRACAIVGVSDQYQYIGVDCEKIISAETAVEIVQVILNSTERRRINKRTEEFAFLVTLVFSAKEAIFKALYPHVKKYFDFYAVELIQLCLKSDFIIFKLQKSLTPSLQKGMKFQLYFTFDQTHITTWLIT